jgi:hypothetical protein
MRTLYLCGLWYRHDAELLHHRHHIDDAPVLESATVVVEADDVDELDLDAPTGCGHAHEVTGVRPGRPHADDDLVATR